MKYKCLVPVVHMGKEMNIGDVIELEPEFADKYPKDFEKVTTRKAKKDGDNSANTDKHDN